MASSPPDRPTLKEEMEHCGARQGFEDDDGNRYFDGEAIAAGNLHWETGGFKGLKRNTGRGPEALAGWRRRTAALPHSLAPAREQGHERRQGDNRRSRGSRRQSGSSPPSSDDDPGEADLHLTLAGGGR